MFEVLFLSILVTIYFYLIGSIFKKKIDTTFSFFCETSLNGIIFLSFFALVLNFFIPLNNYINTIIFITIICFGIFKHKNTLISKYSLYFILITSILVFLLIFLSNSNRPDSGLYHYPYINILNNEKIIFGLSNLHTHFGFVSIIQYTSAILNNFFFKNNGMIFPSASVSAVIFLYLIFEIFEWSKKNKKINFYVLFITFSSIFISYRMSKYSEYGNDYVGHFFMIYLCSLILKYKDKIEFNKIFKYSIFIFLNKIILINVFFLCSLILIKKFRNQINFKTFILAFFLILWLIKNLITTGCVMYPIKHTCIKELSWTNLSTTSPYSVENISILVESWSKGWPDQKNNKLDYYNYNKNFNWIATWTNNHLTKIILTQVVFISIIFFLFLYFIATKNSKKFNKRMNTNVYEHIIFLTAFFGTLIWLFMAPVYRFAISNILIIILFILIYSFKNFLINKTNTLAKKIRTIAIICIVVFVSKNLMKLSNYNLKYNNHPWPKYYSFDEKNYEVQLTPVFQKNEIIYYKTSDLCMYSKPLCTNETSDKILTLNKNFSYKIYLIN